MMSSVSLSCFPSNGRKKKWKRFIKLQSANTLLLSAGGDGRFEVDRKSGQVRTTGLPLQRDREYLLTVVAADRLGSRSAPAVVSVVAGARPPQFTNASFTIAIPENTPEGQPWVHTDRQKNKSWSKTEGLFFYPNCPNTHTHIFPSDIIILTWSSLPSSFIYLFKKLNISVSLRLTFHHVWMLNTVNLKELHYQHATLSVVHYSTQHSTL